MAGQSSDHGALHAENLTVLVRFGDDFTYFGTIEDR